MLNVEYKINKIGVIYMIKLYTSKKYFQPEETITDNESFFNNSVSPIVLDDYSLEVIANIDKAILLDKKIGTIQTPYGITNIDSLSTGCKTVLNYIFLANNEVEYSSIKAIDATECGWNAIEELFKIIEIVKYDLGVIIEHNNKLYNCSDREYLVDNKEIIHSMFEF